MTGWLLILDEVVSLEMVFVMNILKGYCCVHWVFLDMLIVPIELRYLLAHL